MKRLALILALSMPIAACTQQQVYSASASVQGSADALYVAAEKAGEALVATGKLSPAQLGQLSDRAYSALLALRMAAGAVRSSALAGTSTTAALVAQAQALADFNAALHDFQTAVGVSVTSATTL